MGRFIEGRDRLLLLVLHDCMDSYVGANSPVRNFGVFVDEPGLVALALADAAATRLPGYQPTTLLKLYFYGKMKDVQSSPRGWSSKRAATPN